MSRSPTAGEGAGPPGDRSYVVASTPRTGSSLLCAGLWATGLAGWPGEVFAPDFRQPWRRRWGLPDDVDFATYADRALGAARTPNGVSGTKIQWMHVATVQHEAATPGRPGAVLDRFFPGARYLNTVRDDRRAQALSWYRAMHTGQWYRTAWETVAPPPPAPSAVEVHELEAHIEWQQSEWARHVSERGLGCLTVVYEDLSADYRGQVARVLDWLGLDAAVAQRLPLPHLLRQADEVTTRWRHALADAP